MERRRQCLQDIQSTETREGASSRQPDFTLDFYTDLLLCTGPALHSLLKALGQLKDKYKVNPQPTKQKGISWLSYISRCIFLSTLLQRHSGFAFTTKVRQLSLAAKETTGRGKKKENQNHKPKESVSNRTTLGSLYTQAVLPIFWRVSNSLDFQMI